MLEHEISKYLTLNSFAETNGCVIIGGTEDMTIPLGELKQAFSIDLNLYNRSATALSVKDAADFYDKCVASLMPGNVLIHLGAADLAYFHENPSLFDEDFRKLITCVRRSNPKCKIVLITIKNFNADSQIQKVNQHLCYLANSLQCEYTDINKKHVVSYSQTKEVLSFIYSLGTSTLSQNKFPVYDLVNILFIG